MVDASLKHLEQLRWQLRKDTVDIIMAGGGGHIGGDMSVIDTLIALYGKWLNISPGTAADPERDRFVLSKGHSVEAYYAVLCHFGFLDLSDVKARFSQFKSPYIGHPNNKLAGIEMNSGSLGHGLPVGVGMALAARMDKRSYRTYVVMGDGELAEGSIWEAAMAASHFGLDSLCAIVDRNRLQISGSTEDVMAQDSQQQRWGAFGWHVVTTDGNDLFSLDAAFAEAASTKGVPTVIIANTTKGCGSPVMENKAAWHHRVPTPEEYRQICADFNTHMSREVAHV
ncbi:transketolase subunit A [Coriobacterium glomerans PW2]|uniref:Transketolase subunit A n=1 Tax=Coriobacterium glomerans (strain ATCC 49209 / DSM 20642 / JCM 10262 / PW2) TaxID=700015 RepID=F2N935_CORGP|nr:transketolase [Coriobacterium glomerans]AEB07711.1 transketolase subunit A [Coriobacterium glomerans PW2]